MVESSRLSISVLGWALNEQENVGPYIEMVEKVLRSVSDDFELILIDDASSDRTWEIATEYARTRPWLRLYQNKTTRGSGYNARLAISLAQKDYLFWQTVDWAYDIRELLEQLPLLAKYDVLQGVRHHEGSLLRLLRERSDNLPKAVISLFNYALVRILFRFPLQDYQNVTVYPRRLIQSVPLECNTAFLNPECLLKVWWSGASIREVRVPFLKRTRGTAKGTRPGAILAATSEIVSCWCRWELLGRWPKARPGKIISLQDAASALEC